MKGLCKNVKGTLKAEGMAPSQGLVHTPSTLPEGDTESSPKPLQEVDQSHGCAAGHLRA